MGFLRDFFTSSHDDDELLDMEGGTDGRSEPPPGPTFDGVAVLEAAGVSAAQRRHVDKARELLASLPSDASPEVERQIVEAAFRAFDVPLADILDSARAEIDAFEAFIEAGEEHEQEVRQKGEARIAELEAEIARIRRNVQRAEDDQRTLAAAASDAMEEVRPVLAFFDAEDAEEASADEEESDDGERPASVVIDMSAGD